MTAPSPLGIAQIMLLSIGLVAFVVGFASWIRYVREGGVLGRPQFSEQRTPRERQLAKRSRRAGLALLDIWQTRLQ